MANAPSAMQENMMPEIVGIWFPRNGLHIGSHIGAYGVITTANGEVGYAEGRAKCLIRLERDDGSTYDIIANCQYNPNISCTSLPLTFVWKNVAYGSRVKTPPYEIWTQMK
jgi:hypothetical protein